MSADVIRQESSVKTSELYSNKPECDVETKCTEQNNDLPTASMNGHLHQCSSEPEQYHPLQQDVETTRTRHKSLSTAGDYEWYEDKPLGEGTFGAVFKGAHKRTGRQVAVKKIEAGTAINMIEVRSIHEVANRCPYIVDYLAVFNEPMATFVVMQLLDIDLASVIARHKKLTNKNLDTIAQNIAKGYLEVSRAGIVHRDIKPNNILLYIAPRQLDNASNSEAILDADALLEQCQDGAGCNGDYYRDNGEDNQKDDDQKEPTIYRAMISDFGSSRTGLVRKASACVVGTPLYMAPEVGANMVHQSSYDHSVDMWSIGVVLYECITGEAPFDERKLCRLFLAAAGHGTGGYVPPTFEGRDDLPEKYHKVVPKLLDMDPKKRPSADQFHDYLTREGSFDSAENESKNGKVDENNGGENVVKVRSNTGESDKSVDEDVGPLKLNFDRRQDSTRSSSGSVKRTLVRLFSCASSHGSMADNDDDTVDYMKDRAQSVPKRLSEQDQHPPIPEEK